MAKRGVLYPGAAGAYAGGVGNLGQAQGNVLNPPGTQPRFGFDWSSPHTWSWFWFIVAVGYVFFVYQIHGGRRGGVL
jgi:hypothetical protein